MGRPKLIKEPTVSLTAVVLQQHVEALRLIAEREERSLSWVVRRALAESVATHGAQHAL